MAGLTQADRAFRVETPLGEDVLLLQGFSGQERVSMPFLYTLELLSEDDALDPDEILREAVRVSMRLADGSDRIFHGYVSRFVQAGKSEELTAYEAEVVPWLWFLSLTRDCRVFQNLSVLEVIEEIFSKYGGADYQIDCVGTYPPREYLTQYRESDLNFVSRLMEEEGIFYHFEHTSEGHKLRLADDRGTIQPCPVQPECRVATTPSGFSDEDIITEIEREHALHTTKITLTDYDYLRPWLDLESTASVDPAEEVYDYPGGYVELSDGERYANMLLEERAATGQVLRGSSTCRDLRTGHRFDLRGHYRRDTNVSYFVLGVWHTAHGGGYRTGEGETEYTNQFECIPSDTPYRPPHRARRPIVQGSQTAVVVGPSGEEIYTDPAGHGRVKVQFHWDRLGQENEHSSCWVRCSHPWAGRGWGAVAIPRIGQEVIIDFLEGNPDRPIITGRVYNAGQMPPYANPGLVSGLKSQTHKGSGYNEISMDDTAGKEKLTIHGQYDMNTKVQHSRTTTIKSGNDTISVEAGTRSVTVKGDTSLTVQAGSRKVSVTGGDYSGTASQAVKLHGKGAGVSVTGDAKGVTVTGTPNVDISGASKAKISSPEIDIGDATIKIHGTDVTITGSTITIQAKGGTVTVDAGGVSISGAKIKSAAGGVHVISGAMVKIN